jgi:hypothetical protein
LVCIKEQVHFQYNCGTDHMIIDVT